MTGLDPKTRVAIRHLYISPGHNFFGHHGRPQGNHPMTALDRIECLAGRGIRGDRYCDHGPDHKGQITFFAEEIFDQVCAACNVWDRDPSVFRRNVITRGVDLNGWIDRPFELQGVRFFGVEECKPCYWMDTAFGAGAEEAMKGLGGLRARILTDGILRLG
jgi:MOSC domain-containing protein YiiM